MADIPPRASEAQVPTLTEQQDEQQKESPSAARKILQKITSRARDKVLRQFTKGTQEVKEAFNLVKWLGQNASQAGKAILQTFEKGANFIFNSIPRITSFFTGGAATTATVTTGVTGGLAAGGGAIAGAGAAGAATGAAAGAAGAATGAAAGAAAGGGALAGLGIGAATVEVWGPVLLIALVVLLIIGLGVLVYFFLTSDSGTSIAAPPNALVTPTSALSAPIEVGTTPGASLTPVPFPSLDTVKPMSEDFAQMILAATQQACIPPAMLTAIAKREAGLLNLQNDTEQFDYFNQYGWWTQAKRAQTCGGDTSYRGGYSYNTCTNEITKDATITDLDQYPDDPSYGAYCGTPPNAKNICRSGLEVMGIMQFEKGTWGAYEGEVQTALAKSSVDRRVVEDAVYGAALKLKDNSQSDENLCSGWTLEHVTNAARRYYGACTYNVGGVSGNYCKEVCELYNANLTVPSDMLNCDNITG